MTLFQQRIQRHVAQAAMHRAWDAFYARKSAQREALYQEPTSEEEARVRAAIAALLESGDDDLGA